MFHKDSYLDIYTQYKDGAHHYVSIPEMLYIIKKMKKDSSMIRNYISFNPFYRHKDFQIEIDERIFYIEFRDKINNNTVKEFYNSEICEEDFYNIDLDKRTFLIQKNDNEAFIKSLDGIISYLDVLIPYILQRLKSEYSLKEKDLLFGNVCFEVSYE